MLPHKTPAEILAIQSRRRKLTKAEIASEHGRVARAAQGPHHNRKITVEQINEIGQAYIALGYPKKLPNGALRALQNKYSISAESIRRAFKYWLKDNNYSV